MSSPSETTPLSRSPSPARTGKSQRSSPHRPPLHERSSSKANEITSPTIRIVDDSDSSIYTKSPYPTHPSQVLRPRNASATKVFEEQGSSVSEPQATTNALLQSKATPPLETLVPSPLQLRKPNRNSGTTVTSDDETVACGSSSVTPSTRFSQASTPPLSPTLQSIDRIASLEKVENDFSESKATVRAVIPSVSSGSPTQDLTSQPSKASLTSLTSEASTIHYHERSSSASSTNTAFQPLVPAKKPLYAYPRSKKRAASSSKVVSRAQPSSESLASSTKSGPSGDRPRSASAPSHAHAGQQAASRSAAELQYPVVRSAQASGSWAESYTAPKHSTRMSDRISGHRWSSQLSTIQSESDQNSQSVRNSQSIRNSQSVTSASGRSPTQRKEATIQNVASSSQTAQSNSSDSSISVPRPLFSIHAPVDAGDADERHDTIAELQAVRPLRQQRSGYLSRFSSDSRPSSSRSRPGTASSSQSDLVNFIANTIPAWAKVYYRRGEDEPLPAPDTSTEASDSRLNTARSDPSMTPSESNFPLSIYRPRNRPHHSRAITDSVAISDVPVERDLYVIGPVRHHLRDGYGTPRLHADQRSTAHLSAWRAPSFNDTWASLIYNRGNRQILLFGLGFIFPLAWILGAVLPLPLKPELSKEATPSQLDVERVMARNLGPIDELQYQKARWWRNLNRIMSVVGVLLIATIIALAVVAAKMTRSSHS